MQYLLVRYQCFYTTTLLLYVVDNNNRGKVKNSVKNLVDFEEFVSSIDDMIMHCWLFISVSITKKMCLHHAAARNSFKNILLGFDNVFC